LTWHYLKFVNHADSACKILRANSYVESRIRCVATIHPIAATGHV
jgi:hypothetical protein